MKAVIEGLLFLSGEEGLTLQKISEILEIEIDDTKNLIKELYEDYKNNSRGITIEYLGNAFKLTTKKEYKEYFKKIIIEEENAPLSQAAIETLAIIAYNEPITRVEIDNIRGVSSIHIVRKLLLKNLIEEVGISENPGKPKLYGVTNTFLDYFGLGSIEELPKIEENIEEIDNNKNLFESKYTETE